MSAQATWSAISLAGCLRRGDRLDEAAAVLSGQIDRCEAEGDKVAMWEALALVQDAAGDRDGQLDSLGRAYAGGGHDACQILAGLALREGRFGEATRLFAGLIDQARTQARDPEPWALPGWGLSLLGPDSPSNPVPVPAGRPERP
ncbi:MAG: hypothetical protein R3E96_04780 [Planctomycetota bacterium]